MKVRLILAASKDGNLGKEEVTFTDDFETEASDYCTDDLEITFDKVIEADLPDIFPLNSTLSK